MGVSKYRGRGGLYWKTLLKWMIWGYPYFWKHPKKRDYPDQFLFFSDGIGTLKIIFDREGFGSLGLNFWGIRSTVHGRCLFTYISFIS